MAVAEWSGPDGTESLETLREELARRERELRAVHRITARLHAHTRVDDLCRETLLAAIDTVEGSAGSILLHDPETDYLVFRYVVGPSPEITRMLTGRAIRTDEGIAGAVFRAGEGRIARDAAAEACHNREIDLATHYETRSILNAPLKTTEGDPIGVMQILNRREGEFDGADLAVLEILSSQAAAAIETATLHARLLDTEVYRKRFTSEVLRCVTGDKLHVVDADAIPVEGETLLEVCLETEGWYPAVRTTLQQTGEAAGMPPEALDDLVLAVGEATTNSVKHAAGGRCVLHRTEDRIIARVSDRGKGIRPEDLPAAVLQAGYSTKVSLGMGYTVMLRTTDRIWLATGSEGTTVQLEKWLRPHEHQVDPLEKLLERFGNDQ